jgi:hypothetical protein
VTIHGGCTANRIYLTHCDYKQLRQSHWVTHSRYRCNYNTHEVFLSLTSRCLVAASNGGRSPSSSFPNCPRPQLPASSYFSRLQLSTDSTQVKFMLWPTVSRPVCLGVETPDSSGFVDVGRPLWREDGSVVYNCCWPSTAHSYSGPSPADFIIIFFCLRLETSPPIVERPGPRIYIPHEQGGPVIPPGTGFPFRCLLRPKGYSGGIRTSLHVGTESAQKTSRPLSPVLLLPGKERVSTELFPSNGFCTVACLHSCYLAMGLHVLLLLLCYTEWHECA